MLVMAIVAFFAIPILFLISLESSPLMVKVASGGHLGGGKGGRTPPNNSVQKSIIKKIINIEVRSTYYIFCHKNKTCTDPALLYF